MDCERYVYKNNSRIIFPNEFKYRNGKKSKDDFYQYQKIMKTINGIEIKCKHICNGVSSCLNKIFIYLQFLNTFLGNIQRINGKS